MNYISMYLLIKLKNSKALKLLSLVNNWLDVTS